jgi:glycosyltransferase involved in cell wall biosynthesis
VRRFGAVHQFHSGTADGDAITNQMLAVQGHLQSLGFDSEVFAQHIGPNLSARIRSLSVYGGRRDELLLVHHSIGHDLLDDIVALPNPIVAVYHNVTPETYFSNPFVRDYIRKGREQLGDLARRSLFGVADSNFNRRDMLAAGFRRVEVLPVRTDYSTFASSAAATEEGARDWLYVGRVVGNKCQHRIVRAFASFVRNFDPNTRLVLVGDLSDHEYVDRVRAEAKALAVEDRVILRGKVSDRELLAVYARAGV